MCVSLGALGALSIYKKIVKTDKKADFQGMSLSLFIYGVSKDNNVQVFAVTLLFILLTFSLLTRDSFLSLCQSPVPPHFCTDDVMQSAENES